MEREESGGSLLIWVSGGFEQRMALGSDSPWVERGERDGAARGGCLLVGKFQCLNVLDCSMSTDYVRRFYWCLGSWCFMERRNGALAWRSAWSPWMQLGASVGRRLELEMALLLDATSRFGNIGERRGALKVCSWKNQRRKIDDALACSWEKSRRKTCCKLAGEEPRANLPFMK
ncbi:hypothetical protein BS78_10G247100 [Paspalum vaginatum]|nr:hypothetical protein BS78_10G247100 [Paspalum vaginatum]